MITQSVSPSPDRSHKDTCSTLFSAAAKGNVNDLRLINFFPLGLPLFPDAVKIYWARPQSYDGCETPVLMGKLRR